MRQSLLVLVEKKRKEDKKTKKQTLKTAALNPTEQLSKGKTAGIKKRTNNTRKERKKTLEAQESEEVSFNG